MPAALRHRLARPLLALHRLKTAVAGNDGFRVLLLHDIPAADREVFADLVDHVRRHHGVLSPDEAAGWLDGRQGAAVHRGRPPCLFSFDDGFASNADIARDILAPAGIAALFFVCPGLIDLAPGDQAAAVAGIFDGRIGPTDLDRRLRPMTWEEIAALAGAGHTIGAHSMSHRRLTHLRGEDLAHEILDSGARIEARLGLPVPWFAYPFGDIDSIDDAAMRIIAGRYRYCRSGVRGANGRTIHPLALRGDHVDLTVPPAWRQLTLEGGLDGRYRAARRRLDELADNSL